MLRMPEALMEEKKMKNESKKINLQFFAEEQAQEKQPEDTKKVDESAHQANKSQFNSAEEFQRAYRELQENSVPKSVVAEKDAQIADLTRAIIDGTSIPQGGEGGEQKPEIKELAKSMLEDGIGNLEFAKRTLEYRAAVIEKTGHDPFVALNSEDPDGDGEKASNVADVLKDCVEKSGGSDSVFTALLNEKLKDTPLANATKGRARRP